MKNAILLLFTLLCFLGNSQINVFPYSQSFSNVVPTDFTSTTPDGWNFTNDPGNSDYNTKLIKLLPTTKFIYIRLTVKEGYTYIISLKSKNICSIKLSANETPDQNTLLESTSTDINGCKGKAWRPSSMIYTTLYNGTMYFQISVDNTSGSGFGEDDVYIDDILITETEPVALPITLLYFKVENMECYNRITWSTASESNNDFFLLERTQDGFYFKQICKVPGAGNSSSQNFYEQRDEISFDGIVYYKLSQFDFDGQQTTYDLISVDNRGKAAPKLLSITNILGQKVERYEKNVILLFHYENGTVIKRYFLD